MKRLIILPLLTVLVLAFAAAACGASGEDSGEFATSDQFGLEPGPYYAGARARLARQVVETVVVEKPVSGRSGPPGALGQPDAEIVERKIVTNVDMNVRVDDVDDAMELVTDLVDTSGGFVVSVSRTEDEFESFAFMSFRVPSNILEVTLSRCAIFPSALNVRTGLRRTSRRNLSISRPGWVTCEPPSSS